jgi:hypothetical protein
VGIACAFGGDLPVARRAMTFAQTIPAGLALVAGLGLPACELRGQGLLRAAAWRAKPRRPSQDNPPGRWARRHAEWVVSASVLES